MSSISRLFYPIVSSSSDILCLPPTVLLKTVSWTRSYLVTKNLSSSSSSSAVSLYMERITNNVARIYARRIFELTLLSSSTTAAATAAMSTTCTPITTTTLDSNSSSLYKKPSEWSTILNFDQQRNELGESISTLGKTKMERVWAATCRILHLSLLVCPFTVLLPMSYISQSYTSTITNYTWSYSLWAIEKAGPTFMKLFQWATTRHDLFPATFIQHFTKLQDDTMGHSWEETVGLLQQVYGKEYIQLFDFDDNIKKTTKSIITTNTTTNTKKSFFSLFSSQENKKNDSTSTSTTTNNNTTNNNTVKNVYHPIGSGCIAQVYKATLKKNTSLYPAGTEVAIKVIHPGILHKVCIDFYILHKLMGLLEKIPFLSLDYLSIQDSVSQFRNIMLPQLDLRIEARNLRRFQRDFESNTQVSFPTPIEELTFHPSILVETFIHGIPIMEWISEDKSTTIERQEVATIGLETVMKMIFLHDFVHGDLHPGNILIDRNMKARGKPLRINLLDCGLVVEMGERDHQNLVKILGALVKKDGLLAAQHMVDTSKKCQASPIEVELFKKGIQRIIDDDEDNNFLESVGDYLADICYLACKYKVKLESSFINAALACEIMEGIASKLYPDMKVQMIALPMVVKAEIMHGLKGIKFL